MRGDDEREPVGAAPLAAGVAEARVEGVIAATARGQEARVAIGILDRIVHGDDPHETHDLDLRVGEHVADQAGELGVGLDELAARCLGTNVLGSANTVALPQHPLEDTDLGRDASRGLEALREQNALGVQADPKALRLEMSDPGLTAHAVGGDLEGNDSVLLAPPSRQFGSRGRLAQEPLHPFDTTELVEGCFDLLRGQQAIVLHQSLHSSIGKCFLYPRFELGACDKE